MKFFKNQIRKVYLVMKINKILMLMVTSSLILGSVGCGEKKSSKTDNTYLASQRKSKKAADSSTTSKDQHRINDDMKTGRIRDDQKVVAPSNVTKKEVTTSKVETSDKDTHRTPDEMKVGRIRDEQKINTVSTESVAKPQTVTPKEVTPKNDLLDKDQHRVSDDMRIGRSRDEQKAPATVAEPAKTPVVTKAPAATKAPAPKNECKAKECNVKNEALDKDLHRTNDELKVGRIRDEQESNANTPKVTPKATTCKNCKQQHKVCKNPWLDIDQHRIDNNQKMGTHRNTTEVCSNSDRKRIRKYHHNDEFNAQYLWGSETIRGF